MAIREELKAVLEKRAALEKQLDRYSQPFPTKMKFYKERFGCSEQETQIALYISDYILTSTELREMTDEERIDGLFESLIVGRDEAGTDFLGSLFIAELSLEVVNKIRKAFNNQRNKGFPLNIVRLQTIDTIIRPFFQTVGEVTSSKIDLRWIIAQIEGTFYGEFTHNRYGQIIQKLQTKARRPELYYWAGNFLAKRLFFDIDPSEYISKTSFETQRQGHSGLLFLFEKEKVWVGTTTEENSSIDMLRESAKGLLSSMPANQSENGSVDLKYYQTFAKRTLLDQKRSIFTIFENDGERHFLFILFSTNRDEINYTAIRKTLQLRFIDSLVLTKSKPEQIVHVLSLWAEHILVAQTVEGVELIDLPSDLDREKIWALDSIVHAKHLSDIENTEILAKQEAHGSIETLLKAFVEINSKIHEIVDILVEDDFRFEILPFEAFFEGENGEDAQLFIFHTESGQMAMVGLQSLFTTSVRFIHRKEQALKRKYARLQIPNIVRRRVRNHFDWTKGFFQIERLDEELIPLQYSINLQEKHAGKSLEREHKIITGVSVSERFKALERKQNVLRQIQSSLLRFFTQSLSYEIEIEMLYHPKLEDLSVDSSYIKKRLHKSKDNYHNMISSSQIRKIPHHISERVFDILKTLKYSIAKDLREGLSKWHNLEKDLTLMEIHELEAIVDNLLESLDSDSPV